jgi:hypothetical protein
MSRMVEGFVLIRDSVIYFLVIPKHNEIIVTSNSTKHERCAHDVIYIMKGSGSYR